MSFNTNADDFESTIDDFAPEVQTLRPASNTVVVKFPGGASEVEAAGLIHVAGQFGAEVEQLDDARFKVNF